MPGKRYYELDLLRFFAAFAVVLFHYTFRGHAADNLSVLPFPVMAPVTKYGFIGVDLFFLVSGFVILMTAASGSVRHFVVSRIVRLYPAFWVCCTATFFVSLFIARTRHVSFHDYLINLTMFGGFLGTPAVDAVYWSLLIEIRFYFLVFLVLLFRQMHRAKQLLGVWLLLYVVMLVAHVRYVSYLLIPDFAPYFIAGAMFFIISKEGLSLYKTGVIAVCYGLIARFCVRGLRETGARYHTSYSSGVVVALLAVFFLVFFLVSTRRTSFVARKEWMILGALTYPLYLLHQNIGYGLFNVLYPRVNAHFLLWGVIAAMLIAAFLVTRVERACAPPLRDWLLRRASPRSVAAAARAPVES